MSKYRITSNGFEYRIEVEEKTLFRRRYRWCPIKSRFGVMYFADLIEAQKALDKIEKYESRAGKWEVADINKRDFALAARIAEGIKEWISECGFVEEEGTSLDRVTVDIYKILKEDREGMSE